MLDTIVSQITAKSAEGNNFVQIFAIFTVSLGGFSLGAHYAWPSPSIPQLITNSSYIGAITIEEASYFSIIHPMFLMVSSFLVAIAMRHIGRKYIIGFMTIPYMVGWILIAKATSLTSLYIARAVIGISDAIYYSTVSVYIGEISTPDVRQKWGTMSLCVMLLGLVTVASVGAYVDIPITACILISVPCLQLLMIIFLPESPYFLLAKNQHGDAKIALSQLRWKTEVDSEFLTLTKDVERQISESGRFRDLFCIATNRKALLVSILLRTCQNFSGLSAFVTYSQFIFQLAGAESISAEVSSIAFYSVYLLSSIFNTILISKYNRRLMLTVSSVGCAISLFVNAVYFCVVEETDVDVSKISWLPLLCMVCYITSEAFGLAVLPTLITGELFSVSIKNHATFVSTAYLALTMVVVPKMFQLMVSHLQLYITFSCLTFTCILSAIYSYYCVPETKGKTLEEIQQLLRGK